MANIKEYKIVINGLEESINAVDSLNKQLDALEKRINALQSKSVNIGVSSTSSSGGRSSNASALSAEEATQREINKLKAEGERLDAKIAATQDEIYKRVDATKQLYKETVADQKSIAAQERLVADTYSNTMQGMKAKLADIKSVINTTDLGDSDKIKQMTKEANELASKLKEMKEAYGQFGQNVGNYANGVAEGLQKVRINVGGVVREFDSAREASRTLNKELNTMAANGQQSTEAFKELRQVVMELDSNIADAKKPMDNLMDAMEGIMAVANVGQGLRALFGVDDAEIQKSIKNLVALQNVLKGLETINKQIQTREGVGKWIAPFTTQIDAATKKLLVFNRALLGTSKAAKVAAVGIKAFGTALKTAVSMGILVVVDLLVEKVMDLVESFKKVDEKVEATKKLNTELARTYAESSAKIALYTTKIKAFNGTKEEEKRLVNEINRDLGDSLGTYKSLSEWMDALTNKGADYITMLQMQAKAQHAFNMMMAANQKMIEEGYKDPEEYKRWYDKFIQVFTGFDTNALAKERKDKIHKEQQAEFDFWKEEWTKNQEKLEEYQKEHGIGMYAPQFATDTKNKVTHDMKELNELELRLMKDGLYKRLRQLDEEERQILAKLQQNAKKNEAEIRRTIEIYSQLRKQEIDAYMKDLKESLKKASENVEDIQFDVDMKDIELSIKKIDKMVEMLKGNEPIDSNLLTSSEILQKLFGIDPKKLDEARELLEAKSKKISDTPDVYFEYFEKKYEKMSEEQKKLFTLDDGTIDYVKLEDNLTSVLYKELQVLKNYGNKIDETLTDSYDRRISALKTYENESLDLILEENKKQYILQVSAATREAKHQKLLLKKKFDNTDESLRLEYEKTKEAMKAIEAVTIEKGIKMNDEQLKQYKGLQKIADGFSQKRLDNAELYGKQEEQIEKDKQNNITKLLKDAVDKREKIYDNESNRYLKIFDDMLSKSSDVLNSQPKGYKSMNLGKILRFPNIKASMKEIDEVKKALIASFDEIQNQKIQLELAFKDGIISKKVYDETLKNLEEREAQIILKLQEVEDASKKVLDAFIGAIASTVQLVGQSIQQVMQAVWQAQDAEMEKEFDELDKWNEELDKKLKEQQDIVEKHKDNVESIEDELATARGDRRQHLIDQINAEVDAQRAAQKEEQRIKREQEKAKKKEEALEKKRREEEYKRNVMQAFISWHLSIANGLATQPFMPVGIAMGALATTLGAIQYALVKSQKPYAKGGQLDGGVAQGKRHRDGGIPVLGGRASIEGGEFITNRTTTAKNIDLLEYINSKKKRVDINDLVEFYGTTPRKTIRAIRTKFEDGGYLPTLPNSLDIREQLQNVVVNQDNRPIYVSVVDINNKQEDVRRVQALAGL